MAATTGQEGQAGNRRPALGAYFALGAVSIVVQALLIRAFLVSFQGNEFCIGIIFGSWFAWVVIGTQVGAVLARRVGSVRTTFWTCLMAAVALAGVQLWVVQLARAVVGVPAGMQMPLGTLVWFAPAAMFPFPLLMGALFPLGTRLLSEADPDARALGTAYMIEAFGALCGGAVFTLLLAGRAGPLTTVGLLLTLLAAPLVVRPGRILRLAVAGAVAAGIVAAGVALDRVATRRVWRSLENPGDLVAAGRTRYQQVLIAEAGTYNVYSNGDYLTSFPLPYAAAIDVNYALSQHPEPRSALVIGELLGDTVTEMLAWPGLQRVDCVVLDRRLAEMVGPLLDARQRQALADPRVRVIYGDGRSHVKRTRRRYDVVYARVPDPTNAFLNRYYTVEFFREVKRVLAPGGVLALDLSANPNYLGPEMGPYASSVYRSLTAVFGHVVHSHGDTIHFAASDVPGVATDAPDELARRFTAHGVDTDHFFVESFHSDFQPERVRDMRERLLAHEVRLNNDLHPITYFYSFLLWSNITGGRDRPGAAAAGRGPALWRRAAGLRSTHLLAGAVVLSVLWAAVLLPLRPDRRRRLSCVAATGVMGFTAMGLSVLLLLAYQNLFGYLYHAVALLTALFMLGLVVGTLVSSRTAAGLARPHRAVAAVLAADGLYALALPLLLGSFSSGVASRLPSLPAQALYALLLMGAGCLTGLNFPLAARLHGESRLAAAQGEGRAATAGALEAADHGGALLGAVAVGAVLVPVVGMTAVCRGLGVLCMTGALAWSLLWRVSRP